MKIVSSEPPLKGSRYLLVVFLKAHQSLFQGSDGWEIVWREYLALNDGEVDLDLVQPAGVYRSVDGNEVGISGLETIHATCSAVRRSIVYDPEDALRVGIGRLTHHLSHQTLEGGNTRGCLTSPEEF